MRWFNLILGCVCFMGASPQKSESGTQNGDRTTYYLALQSHDLTKINAALELLKTKTGTFTGAFEAALLMKKSGLISNAGEKLELFKQGRTQLEKALAKNGENAELHFLRLIVQENAPKILHYDSNIKEDASFIGSTFNSQDSSLRQEILNYSKTSVALKTTVFHE
ncbi:MAG: hypothetical protein PSX36_16255 [bacterium]|nr:hypothetical protein [bacterium]